MSVRKRKWKNAKGVELEAWVVDYSDQHGKRRHKTFAKKKDADAYAAKTHTQVLDGTHVAEAASKTVKEAGELWIKSCTAAKLERSTLDQYSQHLNLHIVPYIGREKLSRVTVPFVRAFLDRLREGDESLPMDDGTRKPRSDAMVRNVKVSLGAILSDAQQRGLIVRNAVKELGRSRATQANAEARHEKRVGVGVDIPTTAEVKAMLKAAVGRNRVFLMTAVFTGMRSSELRGLRWEDVDLQKAEITVRQRADAYYQIGSPKSKAGRRTIPLVSDLVKTLREWKLACPNGKLGLVFPTGPGKVEGHSNIIKRWYTPVQIAASVTVQTGEVDDKGKPTVAAKYPGLHALRHFYASWCINSKEDGGLGLSPKVVQHRLGHSTIQMTLDVYGHLFPSGDNNDVMDKAASALLV
ncbi:tyrosine-type recombinase/integrase [Mesorhizobium yinganensis]|uniref:tyrosine-type recombinase/integrase n=1 Tax=Mesorhizobium yinganensis TaxID=3157707 RepID=UPI0032B75533